MIASAVEEPAAENPRILVVEDEIFIRFDLADRLREQGYVVIEAASGDEARAVLGSSTRVDLVVSDIRMPGTIDGTALVSLLRASHPSIKVILTSGHHPDVDVRQAADGFFPKPYDFDQLFRAIRTLLDPEQGARLVR